MKTTSVNNNLFQLTRLGFVNCYLVREDDGFTLIDAGLPGSTPAILEAAKALNLPIVRIALTHAHLDHIGSLDALHQALPEAEVVIGKRDARFLRGDNSLDASELQKAKLRGSFQACTTKPTRELLEGDHVGSLEVIASPGHTPGHIAFLDLRDRSLIAGDAFQTLGGVAVAGTVTLFPLPAMGTWHKPTALQSARKLHSLKPAFLAIGHGRVLVSPGADMEKAIATLSHEVEK